MEETQVYKVLSIVECIGDTISRGLLSAHFGMNQYADASWRMPDTEKEDQIYLLLDDVHKAYFACRAGEKFQKICDSVEVVSVSGQEKERKFELVHTGKLGSLKWLVETQTA